MGAILSPAQAPATVAAKAPEVHVCTRCVMDTTDPDITFDAEGVCCHCHQYTQLARQVAHSGDEGQQRLTELATKIHRDGLGQRYDCVIGVSGGVDSTFVAYKVKQLGLRPLAVHLDNGWDSESAVSNISMALKVLGIELQTHVIEWEEFKDIQLAFLRSGVPDCEIPTDHANVSAVHHAASRLGIRHVIWGFNSRTETHLPPAWSRAHYDWRYIKAIHRRFGSGRIRSFPHLDFWAYLNGYRFTQTQLNLLDYVDLSKAETVKILERELGWRNHGGKHYESVYTRWYQGWFLPVRFGYDKRKTHLSSLICSGEITRADALLQLEQPVYPPEMQRSDTEYVMKKLGLSPAEFQAILTAPKRSFYEFPSYWKWRHGPTFRALLRAYQFVKYDLLRLHKTRP